MARTQTRLATGNRVNSALDNPTNFFTASGLNARAGELNGLIETIANIDHMGRFKQKLIDRKRRRDLNNSAGKVAASIRQNQKARGMERVRSGGRSATGTTAPAA